MSRQGVRGLVGLAATTGLLVLIWAAVAGPVAIFGASGHTPAFPTQEETSPTRGSPPSLPRSGREMFGDRPHQIDLSWIGDLIVWTLFLGLLAALGAGAAWLWRSRSHRPPKPVEVDFDVLPEPEAVADALARDIAAQLDSVDEGTPRNGIVRCWLRLEQATAEAGLPRDGAETSAEFTVRVLKALDIDPRAIGELARLYREARFSDHDLDESARSRAGSALRRLHGDLRELSR